MFQPARRVQNIVPVTVRQILESREDVLKIGSMDVHMVRKYIKKKMIYIYNFVYLSHEVDEIVSEV
jgi:hypothetical protein